MILRSLSLALGITVLPAVAWAQGTPHGGHSMPMQTQQSTDNPATKAYRDINAKMHRDMDLPLTGDPDGDFIRSMIPHHQGAVEMAKVALQYAKDEQVRQWATDIVREQEREIAQMQAWLKTRGVR